MMVSLYIQEQRSKYCSCYSIPFELYRLILSQGYAWLKDKILNDEGRKQQSKLRELAMLASKFDCSLAQLAIGKLSIFQFNIIWLLFFTNA